eukprot:CAMPEP_0201588642 /NCGR_PEP_ID=MMETSP0190_2-20130828/157372_1 /ASSEMBLY_ACC=CAM_ASM_000263 /TAXON_ID=37353 /ORGANISM="Rosalina sp." /LENGTH=214 /DNA_ID=CAMNT_0048041183 /DNA_START=26 /DNA_END=670 /DNA_ORIENTATION=+
MTAFSVSVMGSIAIFVLFVVTAFGVAWFVSKLKKWANIRYEEMNLVGNDERQHLDESQEIIGREINEIAKYTIGDEADISESRSSASGKDISEDESITDIIRISEVSANELPEFKHRNPSLMSPEKSLSVMINDDESDSESNEEQVREDLLMARNTLNSFDPYCLKETKIMLNPTPTNNDECDKSSKVSALLSGGESSDYKVTSDIEANNSDLP